MNKHQIPAKKIVPFVGELYPEVEPPPQKPVVGAAFIFIAAALVSGLALGSISTYQSADQEQLRQLQTDQQQLQQVKSKVCKP